MKFGANLAERVAGRVKFVAHVDLICSKRLSVYSSVKSGKFFVCFLILILHLFFFSFFFLESLGKGVEIVPHGRRKEKTLK